MAAKVRKEKEETTEVEGKNKKEKKGKPVLLLVLILVFVLLLGGAAAFYFLGGGLPFIGSADEDDPAPEASRPSHIYGMREFQVNLADPGPRRFLRTTMDLAYSERALTREIENRESELRSLIISVLRSKSAADLDEPGGMNNLESELIERLNAVLDNGEIEAIYYKEFIFQ